MRLPTYVATSFVLTFAAGCTDPTTIDICRGAGLCDPPPPPPPQDYVVIVDASPGSTASLATVEPVLLAVLDHAVDRPGSRVSAWIVGEDAETSREIASIEMAAPPRRLRNPRIHRERTIAELRAELVERITPTLEAGAEQRASAIAETVTLAARSPRRSAIRHLIVLSDLRQRSRGWGFDLECPRQLPDGQRFRRLLDRRGLLAPSTFTENDRVVVLDLGLPAIPQRRRCPIGIRRADELRALWVDAFREAGAGSVSVSPRLPIFDPPVTADARSTNSEEHR